MNTFKALWSSIFARFKNWLSCFISSFWGEMTFWLKRQKQQIRQLLPPICTCVPQEVVWMNSKRNIWHCYTTLQNLCYHQMLWTIGDVATKKNPPIKSIGLILLLNTHEEKTIKWKTTTEFYVHSNKIVFIIVTDSHNNIYLWTYSVCKNTWHFLLFY